MQRNRHFVSLAFLSSVTLLGMAGCSSDPSATAPPGDSPTIAGQDSDSRRLGLGSASLHLSTTDEGQIYVRGDQNPWVRHSTVTFAPFFDLEIQNRGRKTGRDLELLVAVPQDLPADGWTVEVNGMRLESLDAFPYTDLRDSHYPRVPHGVFEPQGNGRFYRFPGPDLLGPGETWVVSIALDKGAVDDFQVHFVAASESGLWSSPLADVTALPTSIEGGDERTESPCGIGAQK